MKLVVGLLDEDKLLPNFVANNLTAARNHLTRVLTRFRSDPRIVAWDLINGAVHACECVRVCLISVCAEFDDEQKKSADGLPLFLSIAWPGPVYNWSAKGAQFLAAIVNLCAQLLDNAPNKQHMQSTASHTRLSQPVFTSRPVKARCSLCKCKSAHFAAISRVHNTVCICEF